MEAKAPDAPTLPTNARTVDATLSSTYRNEKKEN